jgi:hypothetical protein
MPVMTQTTGMIVRTWSATADAAGAGNYSRYFDGTLLPGLRTRPGFKGAYLLRRDLGQDGTVELTTHTFWESPEVIRAFAGEDITVSVVEPEAQAMLLDFDRTAAHRSVVIDARADPGSPQLVQAWQQGSEFLQAGQIVAGQQQVDVRGGDHHAERAGPEAGVVALVRVQPDQAVAEPGQPFQRRGEHGGIPAIQAVGADDHDAAPA